jgi:hypothetical protein
MRGQGEVVANQRKKTDDELEREPDEISRSVTDFEVVGGAYVDHAE